ncbi:MAG: signal peptidase I [Alistipes sp.]|nr:signal peptidase I [Alistipes sp.]
MKGFWSNKWFKFSVVSVLYILLCVVWTGNLWMLLGLPIIYDIYISKLFYKYVWHYNDKLRERSALYNSIWGWVDAILWATVAATLLHLFVFQLYKVPTSSMEKTILIGDYLYVSKVTYGPQVPNTPIAMPFVFNTMPWSDSQKSYSEAIQWDYHRLKGLKRIKRGDVVVFNYPEGDTVLQAKRLYPAPGASYYDALRSYQQSYGEAEGRRRLLEDYNVAAHPVDKRENYIKRCVAIPGDTIAIKGTTLYVNGEEQATLPEQQYIYFVQSSAPLTQYMMDKVGVREWGGNAPYYYLTMTDEVAAAVEKLPTVLSVLKYNNQEAGLEFFPNSSNYTWTQDNFGPLYIPQKGATIELTTENLPLYRRIIEKYEGHKLEVRDGQIFIDGAESDSYTFAMDYYWMMGDNRHNSADSRFWGFVPEDHIVGKASFIAFSMGEDGIRWNRLFRKIR